MKKPLGVGALFLATAALAHSAEPMTLVACAPGFPGDTAQAQPTMDAFAAGIAAAAKWPAGRLAAVYHEQLERGLARLGEPDAALALLPLPLYLEARAGLRLEPILEAVGPGGPDETWSLVARRGAIGSPRALDGWSVAAATGYSPRFVREVALHGFGPLPAGTAVSFRPGGLAALREAASGRLVAVLLDRAQASALPSLPFGAELETVTRSAPLPGTLLCRVSGRADEAALRELGTALIGLAKTPHGREVLATVRLAEFRPVRTALVREAESRFGTPGSGGR